MTRLVSNLGRALRASYRALPVSWEKRLALKSAIFRAFSPLLRNTNAYRRWYLDARMRELPTGLSPDFANASVSASATGVARERRYADQVLALATARSPHYVEAPADAPPAALRAKAIAFYLPQFHPIPENDAWWGRGFTEWTNVGKAAPQFLGHEQPKVPGELGYYDLRLIEVMRRQAELAKLHGVYGFCFHYYWFAGRRLLERPLDQYLADDAIDFPFCLCWANENWTRRWDGHDADVLLGQNYCDESDERFVRDILPYLSDRRYIRIDGRPLLIMYRPSLLPDARRTLNTWRQRAREAGLGELFLAMVQFDVEDPRAYGFDAALEFPPHKLARHMPPINQTLEIVNPDYAGMLLDYRELSRRAMEWPVPDYPLFRGLSPGWDNEARKPGRGYTFAHSSPAAYREWLSACADYAAAHPVAGERVLFVNAWNEWAEGAYLEPDRRYGYAYLQATREALSADPARSKVAVVSHDAHPHGAQYLALNLIREIRALGVGVEAVLMGDGVLSGEFAAAAPLHSVAHDPSAMRALALRLKREGVDSAIVNTAVCGDFVAELTGVGIRCVSLIHELPGVIAQYGLETRIATIAEHAAKVVFAGEEVRDGFERYARLRGDQTVIRAQGLYKRNRFIGPEARALARASLREKLQIDAGAAIVLGVGYADLRKGADLFVDAGRRMMAESPHLHFVWVGHPDLSLQASLQREIAQSGCADRFHFVGRDPETDLYYAGADIYALTSREDPYPSVVMEAFEVGLPVAGFEGTGGLDELIRDINGGLAAKEDAADFAALCAGILSQPGRAAEIGARGRRFIEEERSFRHYVFDLLHMLGMALPRISVVVPNYNYARYLGERIDSVFKQTMPVYELIVLDDGSTDRSLQVLSEIAANAPMPVRIVPAQANSGSVFRQWLKGAELARGDYLWIAEADDLAAPDFLATVMPAFADASVAMSYCQSCQIDETGAMLADDYLAYTDSIDRERWRSRFTASLEDELRNGLSVKNTVPNVSAVVFRRERIRETLREHIDRIASFRVAGDWYAYIKLLERGKIAFAPKASNRHRRHRQSVTLGGDGIPHLREVISVQRMAAERLPCRQTKDRADAYAEELYRYFGLHSEEAPTLSAHPQFRGSL